MSDRMIPVPESALRALRGGLPRNGPPFYMTVGEIEAIDALVACLPEPEPTFTDAEALAFAQAVWGDEYTARAIRSGRLALDALAKAGWTAPKSLCPPPPTKAQRHQEHYRSCGCLGDSAVCCDPECCPPPSPALVELVEAARQMSERCFGLARLRAAVAAYDQQEGTA